MARGINKVILIGNLGADPETRYTPNGTPVTNVSLATSESWKDKNTGETQERTEWHKVVFFNKLAEIVQQYQRKGSKLYIEGSLRTNKWTDKDGNDRYTTEIIASEMQMLDSRGSGGGNFDNNQFNQSQSAPAQSQSAPQAQPASASAPAAAPQAKDDQFDDDIPF